MAVRTRSRLFLADACGAVGRRGPAGTELEGRCRLPLADYAVLGGAFVPIDAPGVGAMALLPSHVPIAAIHAASFTAAAARIREVWPERDAFGSTVVIEWPPAFDVDPTSDMTFPWWYSETEARIGKLHVIEEKRFILREPLQVDGLAIGRIAGEWMGRRAVVPRDHTFFRRFYRVVAAMRLGKRRANGAVFEPHRGVEQPIVGAPPWADGVWGSKLPALLVDLEARVGSKPFHDAIDDYTADPGAPPGSVRTLVDAIALRSSVPLDRFFEDFLAGGKLPYLDLVDVRTRKAGDLWRVSGGVRNKGTGEVICPVVLRTDLDSSTTSVRVGTLETARFELETRYHPRALLLDPRGVVFRGMERGTVSQVALGGGS